MTLRIAAAQYPIEWLADWQVFVDKLSGWVADAAANGAQLLVLPEYASMELASLFGAQVCRSLQAQLLAMQELHREYLGLFLALAHAHGVHIVAGSFPLAIAPAVYRNRCYLMHPDGRVDFQDKLQMTRFENEQWLIGAGDEIRVFDTALGRLGINICYDAEFPLFARRQAEAGARLIVVPSCTDTMAGYHRVRIGARARALENQCYVVQSPTVGAAPWSEAVDCNIGAAAVYAPVDHGFPCDGLIVEGSMNAAQWVYADLNLEALETVRASGQVFNYRDWAAHEGLATTARDSSA